MNIVEELNARQIERSYGNRDIWLYRNGKLLRTFALNRDGAIANMNDFIRWLIKFDNGEFNA